MSDDDCVIIEPPLKVARTSRVRSDKPSSEMLEVAALEDRTAMRASAARATYRAEEEWRLAQEAQLQRLRASAGKGVSVTGIYGTTHFFDAIALHVPYAHDARVADDYDAAYALHEQSNPVPRLRRAERAGGTIRTTAGGGEGDCAVCLETMVAGEATRTLRGCAHVYHRACIDKWFECSVFCPVCKADVRVAGGGGAAAASGRV